MKPGTNGIASLSALVAVFMIAQQIASKAVRDGFFLSVYDVTSLPVATLSAAIVSFAAALFFGKFIASFSPQAAVPVLFAGNGALFFAEALLVGQMPETVAAGLYLHTAAFGGAVVSGFWSVINERFDPYTARQVVGRIAGGATFGGVLGGALTWAFSDESTVVLLTAFGASSLICAVGVALVARGGHRVERSREPAALLAGFKVIAENSYPRLIGGIVFLGALMTATVDYVFKAGVVEVSSNTSLVGFFAVFYTVVGLITFIAQAVGSSRVLRWLGVVPTVGMFPLAMIALLGLAILVPGLVTVVLLRGGAMVIENSFYRSGYELLYTPVPRDQKRSAKVLIDLGFDRLGSAAASGLALVAIALAAAHVNRLLLLTAGLVAVGFVATLMAVRREYVGSLARRLRASSLRDNEQGVEHAAKTLAATFVGDIDIWQQTDGDTATATGSSQNSMVSHEELIQRVRTRAAEKADDIQPARLSAGRSVVSEALLATPLRDRLRRVTAADPEWAELKQSAPGTIGQLGDIVLSQRESLEVRLRAAQLLAAVPSARSAATLLEALSSTELALRRASALALLSVCTASPSLRPGRRVLSALAGKELHRPSRHVGARAPFELESPFLIDARGAEISPTLEIVFLLLAIGGETEQLQLALWAITSDDVMQRGTGLEYLDNLLPSDLRSRLLALAANPELTRADLRVPAAVVEGLAQDLRENVIGITELRARFRSARKAHYEAGPEVASDG